MIKVLPNGDGLQFGNLLFFCLQCYIHKDWKIIKTKTKNDYWYDVFPKLKEFLVDEQELKNQEYELIKNTPSDYYQTFGMHYSENDLDNFIKDYLLEDAKNMMSSGGRSAAINIRGTDYISKWNVYGYDVESYIKSALSYIDKDDVVSVVSDDIDFCKTLRIDHSAVFLEQDPVEDFATLLNSEILIGTNSTFSYWAAFIKRVLNDGSLLIYPNIGNSFSNWDFFVDGRDFALLDVKR